MRVAIFSDVHGNSVALDACLDDLAREGGADRIVGAGDFCLDGPKPKRVLRRMREIGAECVRGNTDRMVGLGAGDPEDAEAIAWQRERIGAEWTRWLADLPPLLRIGDGGDALAVAHANPKNDDEHVWPHADDAQLERLFGDESAGAFAFGHLHLPYARVWRGRLLTCVASAGLPKDGDPRAHYAILTQRDGGWQVRSRRVAFDVERVAKQLRKSGMPDVAERLATLRRHRYKTLTAVIP
ncbi:MAG: metallophosphoesterase [Candidatus Velthaea sp.]